MSPVVGFFAFLALTLIGLAGVFVTGMRAQRKKHLPLVALSVALLGITIVFAERLGHGLDLEAAGWIYPLHVKIAIVTTGFYLVPILTGAATMRTKRWRPVHRRVAWLVLILTLLTAATGVWMVVAAPGKG